MRAKAEAPQSIVLAATWRRYKRTGDRETRNKLILAYSPIVKYAAGRMAARMPAHVELADLISYGMGGLIEAVERFEPARGIKFESYAATRIRGAIFDELRSLDWVPRSVRTEARGIEEATAALTARLHRMPTDVELAGHLLIEPKELDASLQRVSDARMIALDQPWDIKSGRRHRDNAASVAARSGCRGPRGERGRSGSAGAHRRRDPAPAGARASRSRVALPPGDALCRDRRGSRGHGIPHLAASREGRAPGSGAAARRRAVRRDRAPSGPVSQPSGG